MFDNPNSESSSLNAFINLHKQGRPVVIDAISQLISWPYGSLN